MTLTVLWSASCLSLSMAEYLVRWWGCSDGIGIDAYFNPDTFIIISTFFGKILFFVDVFAILKLYKYKGEAFVGV